MAGHERAADDVQVVVELGETNVWVTLSTPSGAVAPPGFEQTGTSGRLPAGAAVAPDGSWRWGVERGKLTEGVVVSGFLARVDDPVPLVVDGHRCPATELVARQVEHVVRLASDGRRPSLVSVVHPDEMSHRSVRAISSALELDAPVRWVTRAEAAVTAAASAGDLDAGDVVACLHVGGAGCAASVWSVDDAPRRLGPVRSEPSCAGAALDDQVVRAVESSASPTARGPRAELRSVCSSAKARLSCETAVDVPVGDTVVRLVRTELEEISAPLLARQLDTLADALALAGVEASTVRSIVLTGGSAAAPGLVEAAGSRFDAPATVVDRLGPVLGHDTAAAEAARARAVPAEVQETRVAAPTPAGAGGWVRAARDRLSARWPMPAVPSLLPGRRPVVAGAVAVLAFAAVALGAVVQQASVMGMLAAALGAGDRAGGLSASTLARGAIGPLVAVGPDVARGVKGVIAVATDAVSDGDDAGDGDDGTQSDGTESARGEDPGATGTSAGGTQPTRGGTGTGTQAGGPRPTTPGGTSTPPSSGGATTPSDPTPSPSAPGASDPDPVPEPTTPAPDPTPVPDPPSEPVGDPDPDPAPDPTPDPDPPAEPVGDPETPPPGDGGATNEPTGSAEAGDAGPQG
ncbi:hypothetical protein GCM10023168_14930 [Fodinibacter luteus]|uniref:Hsp70 protein n=1 Tax=Fodinibacter luteus TaxID=552064 RepID=A0ABP8KAU7_9MICO